MTQVRLLSVGAISVFLIYAFTFAMMHSPIMEEDPTSPENATTPMEADVPHSPENAITTMGTAAPHSPESPILCEMNGTDVMITVAHHRLGAFGRNIMYHSPMPGGSQLVILTPTPIAQLPAPFTRSCVITEAGFFEPAGLSARIQALVQSWKSVERAVFITPDHLITGNLANLFQIPTQGLPEHSLISKDPNPHAMVITRTGSPFGLKAPPSPQMGDNMRPRGGGPYSGSKIKWEILQAGCSDCTRTPLPPTALPSCCCVREIMRSSWRGS